MFQRLHLLLRASNHVQSYAGVTSDKGSSFTLKQRILPLISTFRDTAIREDDVGAFPLMATLEERLYSHDDNWMKTVQSEGLLEILCPV